MSLKESKYRKPLLIGLTGGIGSGKSTVAKIFNSFGIKIYNSDFEAKTIVNHDENVIKRIKQEFGDEVYKEGVLDSKILSDIVFNNEKALKKLNAIVHPAVKQHFENWVLKNKADEMLIKEAAILIESGAYKGLDKIVLVIAPEELRIQRVCKRDQQKEEQIRKRIESQMNDEEKMNYVDFIIKNNEEELLLPQVISVYNELKK